MKPGDVVLAVTVAAIWGFAFVVTRVALDTFSPTQLTAARFIVAAVPVLFLPRPPVAWPMLVAIGLTLFTGQFLLQFTGIASGMPPGLASTLVQTQVFFTIVFAARALGERPTARQLAGVAVALAGLALIALTVGGDLTVVGFGLTLGSAVSWGIGNILVKRVTAPQLLSLVAWLSLVPPLPALALSLAFDGPTGAATALARASWLELGAVLYLGLVATLLGYVIWGRLLRRYPAAAVTPFALLAPIVGAGASAVVFGERFGEVRLAGMALVMLGLAVIVLPLPALRGRAARTGTWPIAR